MGILKKESGFSAKYFYAVWTFKTQCFDPLKIILIYFKILKLMTINIIWRHKRWTTEKSQ